MSTERKRILVAIAHHGTKNRPFLEELLREWARMRHDVHVVLIMEKAKPLPDGRVDDVLIGAPTSDPWSLPFRHRELFAQRRDDFDLFVYSEDDTLIEERHLDAHLEASALLPDHLIPGFLRYEQRPDGSRAISTIHSFYRWEPEATTIVAGQTFGRYSNDHAACHVLTAEQLTRAIDSGGYLVPAHATYYDMLVSAATDPYTRCGMQRVLWLERIDDFLLHHLPNVYLDRLGTAESVFRRQVSALLDLGPTTEPTLVRTTPSTDDTWRRSYNRPATPDLLDALPDEPVSVLSVGAANGALEAAMTARGHQVRAVPLDEVVGRCLAADGHRVTPVSLDPVDLGVREQQVIVLDDIVGRVDDPVRLLRSLRAAAAPGTQLIVTAKNTTRARLRSVLGRPVRIPHGTFAEIGIHRTTHGLVGRWLRQAGWDAGTISPRARLLPEVLVTARTSRSTSATVEQGSLVG